MQLVQFMGYGSALVSMELATCTSGVLPSMLKVYTGFRASYADVFVRYWACRRMMVLPSLKGQSCIVLNKVNSKLFKKFYNNISYHPTTDVTHVDHCREIMNLEKSTITKPKKTNICTL